ncbi:hypothetical protein LSH36_891g01007 [Paralvinella palmiformis]|uniref:protein-tyrosine-phosphatase n=1 Tax=Paralvinella palmiformis TaxID=53620 RepID=A0AAD9IZ43_9ANNE|nr:hypothetical protein LSH36_891g01007 [Paralvinella palmiformis]
MLGLVLQAVHQQRGSGSRTITKMAYNEDEKRYLEKMMAILTRTNPGSRCNRGPTLVLDHLYLGNMADAHDIKLLKRLKITHIVNCAATKDYSSELKDNPYPEDTGIDDYLEFEALDNEGYPILRHYRDTRLFIDRARRLGGRVLIHCEMGVNRSAALCIAYLMEYQDLTLIQAIRDIKISRPVILLNESFRRQLYSFADERRLLYPERSQQ